MSCVCLIRNGLSQVHLDDIVFNVSLTPYESSRIDNRICCFNRHFYAISNSNVGIGVCFSQQDRSQIGDSFDKPSTLKLSQIHSY